MPTSENVITGCVRNQLFDLATAIETREFSREEAETWVVCRLRMIPKLCFKRAGEWTVGVPAVTQN